MKDTSIGISKRVLVISMVLLLLTIAIMPTSDNVVSGTETVSIELKAGWNLKGMPKSITASDLAQKSNQITSIVHRTSDGYYETYIPSLGKTDFILEVNEGVFINSEEDVTITFTISTSNGYMGGDLIITGDLNVTGDFIFDKNLTVIGSMSVLGSYEVNSLNVTEDLTVEGDLTVNENLIIGADLTVNGNLMVAFDLIVGNMTITEDMTINDDLAVFGDATIHGDSTVSGDMEVFGNLSAGDFTVGNLTISDDLDIDGNLSVAGYATIGDDLTVSGDAVIAGNLTVGNFTAGKITISEDLSVGGDLTTVGDVDIGGNCNVAGDLSVTGNLAYDDLSVTNMTVTGTVSGLPFATPSDYIVFANGTTIYGKNGKTGELEYQSTDTSDVLEPIIENLINSGIGGKVTFTAGRFNFSRAILIEDVDEAKGTISIEGSGQWRATKLYLMSVSVIPTFISLKGSEHCQLRNLNIQVNKKANYGIRMERNETTGAGAGNHVLENLHMTNAVQVGILGYGSENMHMNNVHVRYGCPVAMLITQFPPVADPTVKGSIAVDLAGTPRSTLGITMVNCKWGQAATTTRAGLIIYRAQVDIFGGLSMVKSDAEANFIIDETLNHMTISGAIIDYGPDTAFKIGAYPSASNYNSHITMHGINARQMNGVNMITAERMVGSSINGFMTSYADSIITLGSTTKNNFISGFIYYSTSSPYLQVIDNGTGNIVLQEIMYMNGTVSIGENLTVGGNVAITGDLTVGGSISYDNLTITYHATIGEDLAVGGNCTINGNLTVNGTLSYTDLSLTGDLTVGGNIKGATGRSVDFVVVASDAPQHWINQGDYFCDGTDDQVEINVAFENCSTGTGYIVLSPGTFGISDTINIPYGAMLEGQGIRQTKLDGSGTAEVVFYNEADVTQNAARGGGVKNLYIDCNDVNPIGLRIRSAWWCFIEGVEIRYASNHGLQVESSYGVYIDGVNIHECAGYGINFCDYDGEVNTGVRVDNAELSNNYMYNIGVTSGAHLTIENVWFENGVGQSGDATHLFIDDNESYVPRVWVSDSTFGNQALANLSVLIQGGTVWMKDNYIHAGGASNKSALRMTDGNLSFVNNHVFNWGNSENGGQGIDIEDCDRALIQGNTFNGYSGSGYAVTISGGTKIDIDNNDFSHGGINVSSNYVKITDNRFTDITNDEEYCIFLDANTCEVLDNYFFALQHHGIYSNTGKTRNKIMGNTIVNTGLATTNTYDGIYVAGFGHIVENNRLWNPSVNKMRYGIQGNSVSWTKVNFNYIEGANTADIYFTGSNTDCEVIGNQVLDDTIIPPTGAGCIVKDNVGYIHNDTMFFIASSTATVEYADYYCDGSDDQIEINRALENCTGGYGTVELSAGTFDITGTVEIPTGATLRGQGHGRDIWDVTTQLDYTGSGGEEIVYYNSANVTQALNIKGCGIYGLSVEGNSVAGTIGIRVRNSYFHVIQDVGVHDCEEQGILIEGSFTQGIYDCQIVSNENDGIRYTDGIGWQCTLIKLSGCDIARNHPYNVNISSGTRVYMSDIWFENGVSDTGVHLKVDRDSVASVTVRCTDVSFGNKVDATHCIELGNGELYLTQCAITAGGSDKDGIRVTSSSAMLIMTGCDIGYMDSGTEGRAVNITACKWVLIEGNTFYGDATSGYAIDVVAEQDVQIIGNRFQGGGINCPNYAGRLTIQDNEFYGIYTTYAIYTLTNYALIQNNILYDCYYNGIYVDAPYNTVSGNMMVRIGRQTDNTYDAIIVTGGDNIVNDNHIFSNYANMPRYGIYVGNQNEVSVCNNYVLGSSTWDIFVTSGSTNCIVKDNICPDGKLSLASGIGNIYSNNVGYIHNDTMFFIASSTANVEYADYYCDGINDHIEINNALQNCTGGYGTVELSAGTFVCEDTILVPGGATLKGAIMGKTILDSNMNAEAIIYNYNDKGMWLERGGGVRDLFVWGDSGVTIGLRVRWAWGVAIERVDIRYCGGIGIQVEASYGLDFYECQVFRNDGYGVRMLDYEGSHNTRVGFWGCDISENGVYNFHLTSGTFVTLDGCWFENGGSYSAEHLYIDDNESTIPSMWVVNTNFAPYASAMCGIRIDGGYLHITQSAISCGGNITKGGVIMTNGNLDVQGCMFGSPGRYAINVTGGYLKVVNSLFNGYSYSQYHVNITGGSGHIIMGNNFTRGGINSTASQMVIQGNTFSDIDYLTYCIYTTGSYNVISENVMWNVDATGIFVDGLYNEIIDNGIYRASADSDNTHYGIHINGARCVVNDNQIVSNGVNKPKYGIYVESEFFVSVCNNFVEGTGTYDIYLTGGGSNLVQGNNCPDGKYSLPGSTGDIYKDNIGFITENYGYSATVSNSDTIPHGLSVTPTIVIITPTSNVTVWVTAITSTTFTVGLPNGTYDIYWYAIYKP